VEHAPLVLFLSGRRHEEKQAKGYELRNMGSVGSGRGRKRPPVGLGCMKERMTWARRERRAQERRRKGFSVFLILKTGL
jgi:hypothetical protein